MKMTSCSVISACEQWAMDQLRHSAFLRGARAGLDELQSRSQLRRLENTQGVTFCSNDYLGLSTDQRLRDAIAAAMAEGTPVGSTGSRLLSGHAPIWDQLESELARFAGTEAALYFSSGYAANVGLLTSLLRPEDVVFSDSANHASIIDGVRLSGARKVIFPHLDLNGLEDALRRCSAGNSRKLIVLESIFSMEGDRAPVADCLALAGQYGAELIVDEAHATGVMGPNGSGLVAEAGATRRILAVVHTCGKALAGMGAFVACSNVLKQYLVNHARTFIFSTALPPYLAAQMRAAIAIVASADSEREQLAFLAGRLRKRLREGGFDTGHSGSQIVPVILGENERALALAARLVHEGFAVKAIRPPTVPPGTARLRLSLTVKHTVEILDRLVDSLVRARGEIEISRCQAG
jgi:8-amino-7-oxononanoate synthase